MPAAQITRQRILNRWSKLKGDRSSWDAHWQDISDFLLPRSGRFFTQDQNRGDRRDNNIYDDSGTRALRTLAAGLMAGATSPARPWFTLSLPDVEMAKSHPVKQWLADVSDIIHRVFHKSNTYRTLHQMYEELAAFGTAATMVLPDFENVIHHYPVTVGRFALQQDFRGRVNVFYREFQMTVSQLVHEFGLENCSVHVQNLFSRPDSAALDEYVTVIHAIEPRAERDATKLDVLNKKFRSIYIEESGNEERVLRESGFDRFPILAPRWATAGGDVYGHCPGMEALGATKQLQHQQLRKANAIDYMTEPPLQVPSMLRGKDVDRLPGGITFFDAPSSQSSIKTLFDVQLDLNHLGEDMRDVRYRIDRAFYADLFLMLTQISDTTQRTAAEIAARHEEKLTMLGPVLNRLHDEMLRPLIELTFDQLAEAGALPEAPPELEGMELVVEFVSMLAQAQRAVHNVGTDRFMGMFGTVAQFVPEIVDKLDADALIDDYADALGVNPRLVKSTESVAEIRAARAQAQQAKEQALMMEQQAKTAKDLAGAQTGPGQQNALTDVMSMFQGYNNPPAYALQR